MREGSWIETCYSRVLEGLLLAPIPTLSVGKIQGTQEKA